LGQLLFLEFGLELKVFWENHFGVVNVDETVKIDEIALNSKKSIDNLEQDNIKSIIFARTM